MPTGAVRNDDPTKALQLSNFAVRAYKDRLFGVIPEGTGMLKYSISGNGQFNADGTMGMADGFNRIAFENDTLAWITSSGTMTLQAFNPKTMRLGVKIDLSTDVLAAFPKAKDNGFKTAKDVIIRDKKLFVTMDFGTNDFVIPYDSAFVAVVDLTTQKFEKLLIRPQARLAGDYYPYNNSMFIDEKNDLYILCLGTFGTLTKDHSKLLRIPSGSTNFDTYELDITAQTGLGSARGLIYAGNGRAITPVLDSTLIQKKPFGFFTESCYYWHEINTTNKTIKKLPLPATNGFKGHAALADGNVVWLPMVTNEDIYITRYDLTTNQMTKQCSIVGGGYVQFITKVKM